MISNEELELELQQIRTLVKGWPTGGLSASRISGVKFFFVGEDCYAPDKVKLSNGVGTFTREQVFPEAPPLGLKPRKLHNEQRAVEIQQALLRYIAAKKPIPSEWYVELCEISPPGEFDNFDMWHPIWDLLLQRELSFK